MSLKEWKVCTRKRGQGMSTCTEVMYAGGEGMSIQGQKLGGGGISVGEKMVGEVKSVEELKKIDGEGKRGQDMIVVEKTGGEEKREQEMNTRERQKGERVRILYRREDRQQWEEGIRGECRRAADRQKWEEMVRDESRRVAEQWQRKRVRFKKE